MLESVFVLFLVVALGVTIFSFARKDPIFLIFGSVLFMASGLLILDAAPTGGLEQDDGFIVRHLGDNNFTVDYNTSYRNAGNDTSLSLLGNILFYGSFGGILMGMGFLIQGRRGGKNG